MSCKKRIVRLDDPPIPKPTDVNVADKMTNIPTLKCHPYSSHISKFDIFPSFRPPADPETGVRASSRPYSGMTVLKKTKGNSCRHEILELPMKTRKGAVIGLDGHKQFSHPNPPKTAFPNAKLCEPDLSRSLPERMSNMLNNLEKSRWTTSYQLQYTAIPLKMDDVSEKVIDHARMNPHSALLREKSHNFKIRFDGIPTQMSQGSKEGNFPHISGTGRPLEEPELQPGGEKRSSEMNAHPRTAERAGSHPLLAVSRADLHNDLPKMDKALQGSAFPPRVLPRPPVPSGRGEAGGLTLLQLQDSFSKSAVQRRFASSFPGAAASLKPGATSRRHNFFGINCYYLRG